MEKSLQKVEFVEIVQFKWCSIALSNTISVSFISLDFGEKGVYAPYKPSNPKQICAPLPGMVSEVAVHVGGHVEEGDKLVVLEAMKMLSTVNSPARGTVAAVHLQARE